METEDFNFFCGIVLSIVICSGIAGNFLSIIIWTSGERCRTYPSAFYFIVLALSDSCNLCFSGLVYAIEYLFRFSLYDVNTVFCKLLRPAGFFFSLFSTWLIVCMTIERTVAVRKPFNSVRWKSRQRRKHFITILSLFVMCLLLELPWTTGLNILPIDTNTTCFPDRMIDVISTKIDAATDDDKAVTLNESTIKLETCQFDTESLIYKYETVWRFWIFDFGLIFCIPLIILTYCNLVALITIRHRNGGDTLNDLRVNRQRKLSSSSAMTARVVAISVVHCISVGPFSVSVLIPSFVEAVNNRDEAYIWLYSFFNFIWYLNHAVNFILYSVFGHTFRQDCVTLCCLNRRESNLIPSTKSVKNFEEPVTLSVSALERIDIKQT